MAVLQLMTATPARSQHAHGGARRWSQDARALGAGSAAAHKGIADRALGLGGKVDRLPRELHPRHPISGWLALYDSTFTRTVWRLYGGAKGPVMWYYQRAAPFSRTRVGRREECGGNEHAIVISLTLREWMAGRRSRLIADLRQLGLGELDNRQLTPPLPVTPFLEALGLRALPHAQPPICIFEWDGGGRSGGEGGSPAPLSWREGHSADARNARPQPWPRGPAVDRCAASCPYGPAAVCAPSPSPSVPPDCLAHSVVRRNTAHYTGPQKRRHTQRIHGRQTHETQTTLSTMDVRDTYAALHTVEEIICI
jgi:hypothetical protein